MNVFNPRILDASIRDVIGCLSDIQKADVLLHALQHLPLEGFDVHHKGPDCHGDAIQSFLQVSGVPPADVARALLLRAKTRIAAGYRTSAQQGQIHAFHYLPCNDDDTTIFQICWPFYQMLITEPDISFVGPHALSRIASQLIFREIDLHFTASPEPPRADNRYRISILDVWHYQRSADILTRILVDPAFASQVRSLSVYAVISDPSHTLTFQTGMLINSLPKLGNLRSVHCSGNRELINPMLDTMCASNHRLYSLSINLVNRSGDINIPPFKHITHFSITTEGTDSTSTYDFISQSDNTNWRFPTDVISVRHLTIIEFQGCFSADGQVFSDILSTGHQLESLTLSGPRFRSDTFSLKIVGLHRHVMDRDLVPAILEFLRDRKHLHSFHLIVPSADHRRIGFDASAWGVLPSLINLRSLCISYPRDLSPSLASWLIPRSVRALTMEIMVPPAEDLLLFMNQLRPGVPPLLTFIGMTNFPIRSVINLIDNGFSNVRVVRIDESVWSIIRLDDGSMKIEQWPYRRIKYHTVTWLESLGCEDAIRHLV
ncbi:hypothetical protein BDR07DRAFT_1410646 [Suillus spraguei]|nr:hypothetical protein BDR07DRAFT_1410646 [Suillus spraguei]